MTSYIHRSISITLITLQIFSTIPGYAYEGVHSLSELSTMSESARDGADIADLIQERESYAKEHSGISEVTTFASQSELMGSSYLIEQSSRLSGEVGNRIVTSDLLYNTLVRNMSDGSVDPHSLAVHPTDKQTQDRALKRISKNKKTTVSGVGNKVISFEFGIPDNHLIFSKPVLLSVDAGDIPNSAWVDLLVLHAGDADYNTSGLMTDPTGECLPDGTASKPATRAQVVGSKVSFYTCGASTFALGYIPVREFPNGIVYSLAPQSDGKMILGGAFGTVGGVTMSGVARVSADGSLDTSFANPSTNYIVSIVTIQSDDKILVGGAFTGVSATTRNYMARLNSDGTLDTSFDPNIDVVSGGQIKAITVQPDGKIIIGGNFTSIGGTTRNRIARLNSDGTLDTSFDPNASNDVNAIVLQSDGKILMSGTFTTVGGTARNRIARLNTDGTLDTSFDPNASSAIHSIVLQSDGKILIGGLFTTIGGVARNYAARLNTDGTLDTTFNPNANSTVWTFYVQPSGDILLAGAFTTMGGTARNRIARVSSTGALDTTFNPSADNIIFDLMPRKDGTIVVGGQFTTLFGVPSPYVSYITPSATRDTSYNTLLNGAVWSLVQQTDGKTIIGGDFRSSTGVTMSGVTRISTGGALDSTFANPIVNGSVYATAIQTDGKTIIGGTFTTVGGTARNRIARLNTDGTLDATFNPNVNNIVRSLKIQSDGKIIIGGQFTTVGGTARNRVARVSSTGALDTTFNPNANSTVWSIETLSTGDIILGGTFTTIGGTTRNRIARVSSTGALNATFNPNANGIVYSLNIDASNNVVFGGAFSTIGATARVGVARVSSTGALDTTFDPNPNGIVRAIARDASGQIIIGGTFTTVSGLPRNYLARVTDTGIIDIGFDSSPNNFVYALGIDISGNLLIGGLFTTIGSKSTPYFGIVGLSSDSTAPQITSISLLSGSILPIGRVTITTLYNDIDTSVDTGGIVVKLEKWNGIGWGANLAPTYLSGAPSISTSTGIYAFNGIPYGKYRFRISVPDIVGNTSSLERTFYVDEIEWSVSQASVDIGDVVPGVQKTSNPDEFIITVKTVGAAFNLTMSGGQLQYLGSAVPHWSGSTGYGYEKYSGGYAGTLSSLSGGVLIVSQAASANTNGLKNTYTYRIQYGARVTTEQIPGDYTAPVSLRLVTNY